MNRTIHNELDNLTAGLVGNYHAHPTTHRIGERFLPSRTHIVEVMESVRQLLFPGFFGHKELTEDNIAGHVSALLVRTGEELARQIYHCVCSDRGCDECTTPEECSQKAGQTAHDFLAKIPAVRDQLVLDAQAAYDGDPAAKNLDEVIYCYPGFYAVTVYRIAHELLALGVPLMPRILGEHAHTITGTDIHPGATIGPRFFIDHATGVVIGETCKIGANVKIYQGVTLGAKSFPKDERGRVIKGLQRHPTIEDDVTIYAGATILGGETVIGQGVTVGGNTFVTQSITAESTVTTELPKLNVRSKK